MGTLLIIRHAQASFMAANYDQLSALGETQARLLGTTWAANNMQFDRVCSGPRVRQKHTAELVGAAFQAAGHSFPDIAIYPEFDEYHAEAVMQAALPILLETKEHARKLQEAFANAAEPGERQLSFQRLFEYVIARWVRSELQLDGVESWVDFCSRVNAGLKRFLATQVRSERVAIFTSAGPTAVALQRALAISPEETLQMSWMPRNSSWSEFLYSPRKFTLSSFNSYGHLAEPSHLTYR